MTEDNKIYLNAFEGSDWGKRFQSLTVNSSSCSPQKRMLGDLIKTKKKAGNEMLSDGSEFESLSSVALTACYVLLCSEKTMLFISCFMSVLFSLGSAATSVGPRGGVARPGGGVCGLWTSRTSRWLCVAAAAGVFYVGKSEAASGTVSLVSDLAFSHGRHVRST